MITNNIIYIQKPLNNIIFLLVGAFFWFFFVKQWRRSWKEHLKVTFSMYRVDFKSYRSCHTLLVSFLIISHFNIFLSVRLYIIFFGLVWFGLLFLFLFPCFICKKNVETCELTHLLSTSEFLYICILYFVLFRLEKCIQSFCRFIFKYFSWKQFTTQNEGTRKIPNSEICVWTFLFSVFLCFYSRIHWSLHTYKNSYYVVEHNFNQSNI